MSLQVCYDDAGRWYQSPSGVWYPSVTTVLRVLSDRAIAKWRKRVGEAEAARISEHACARGTAVHAILEEFCLGKPIPTTNTEALWMASQLMPLIRRNVGRVYRSESQLWSDKLRIAGRCDLIADWRGVPSIIDFKTARKRRREDWIRGYLAQACFYSVAYWQRARHQVQQVVIMIAVDDGQPQTFVRPAKPYYDTLLSARAKFSRVYWDSPRTTPLAA